MEKQVVYQSESPNPIPLTCLSIDKAGKRAACGTTEGQILLIDLEEGTPLKTLTGHEDIVSKVHFLEKGAHLLSSSWDGTTRRWSLQKTKNEPSILKHDSAVKSLAIAEDENKGDAGARSGEVKVFSVQYMKCIRNIQADNPDVLGLHFRNGNSQLLSASWNGSCCVWNLKDCEMLSTLHEDDTRICCFEVTPDDIQVLLGLHDERIRVFSAEDPSDAFTLEGHTDRITDFAILPDNRLASSSWDRTIRLWSLNDEEELQQVKLWSGVCSVQWSTACEKLFATDLSGSLLAWRF